MKALMDCKQHAVASRRRRQWERDHALAMASQGGEIIMWHRHDAIVEHRVTTMDLKEIGATTNSENPKRNCLLYNYYEERI